MSWNCDYDSFESVFCFASAGSPLDRSEMTEETRGENASVLVNPDVNTPASAAPSASAEEAAANATENAAAAAKKKKDDDALWSFVAKAVEKRSQISEKRKERNTKKVFQTEAADAETAGTPETNPSQERHQLR